MSTTTTAARTPPLAAVWRTDGVGTGERLVAGAVLLILLVKAPGFTLVPASVFLGLIMLPVTLGALRASPRVRLLLIVTGAAIVVGLCLRLVVQPSSGTPDTTAEAAQIVLWLVAFPVILLLGAWAITRVGLRTGLVLCFTGATVSTVVNGGVDTWKGTLGFFATLLLLAVFAGRSMLAVRIVLVVAVVLNIVSDARTMALVALIVLLCTLVPPRTLAWVRRHPARATIVILIGFAVLTVATVDAMTSGLLGQAIQHRTLDQMRDGQNLITGGRTEWAASLDLMGSRPLGFGVGVVAAPGLQAHALNAVQAVGGDYQAEYFRTDVFGTRTDLHSSFADLWFHFGLGGVAVAVVMLALLVGALPRALAYVRSVGVVALFAVLAALWDVLFSPMANSDRIITGLLMAVILALFHARGEPARDQAPTTPERLPKVGRLSHSADRAVR